MTAITERERLELWRTSRREELETDTTSLLNALLEHKAELETILGDVLDAMKYTPKGASSLDVIVERHSAVEKRMAHEVDWILELEEANGYWASFEPVDFYEPNVSEAA
jgi:hypothetical protein